MPAIDSEYLFRKFDFAVFPIPLTDLALTDLRGRCLRHDVDMLDGAIEAAINNIPLAAEIFNRVGLLRKKDLALLPPRNFIVDRDRCLERLLREMRRGERLWTDRFEEVEPQKFNSQTLPKL